MSNFVECDRDQAFLLPPDLRDWLPADDLGHFVIEAVERVDLGAFKVNHRGTGSAQYHRGRVGGVVTEPRPSVAVGMRIAAHPPRRSGRGR